jgi:hypothetical protein
VLLPNQDSESSRVLSANPLPVGRVPADERLPHRLLAPTARLDSEGLLPGPATKLTPLSKTEGPGYGLIDDSLYQPATVEYAIQRRAPDNPAAGVERLAGA